MFEHDTIKKEKGKKYDLILISLILFTALILWGILQLFMRPGDVLSISYDGELIGQVSLKGSKDRYYLVQYGDAELIELTGSQAEEFVSSGEFVRRREPLSQQESMQEQVSNPTGFSSDADYNLFVCREDGTVCMLAASCPDQICVNHREIKASMDNIICLPHELILEIVSDRESKTEGLDGIAY